ncbi:MAG: XRE family transcriptional regulator [Micropruina sp.]|uniref:helix-turn-helix domain-containing protein n=1 Tax=Micropruina sp. TaxID=2737536 RepID=UPI0039E53757
MAELDSQTLGSRIREARERVGMKQGELGSEAGLDRTVVNKIEAGVRKVTAVELSEISRALGVRMSSFFAEPIPALVSHRYNQDPEGSESQIDRHLETLATDVEFVHSLVPDELRLPDLEPEPRPRSNTDADHLAARIRSRVGLSETEPVLDLIDLAGQLGLLIFSVDLGVDTADAGTILLRHGGVSLVNSHNKVGRRRLAAAHELGHYLVADEYTIDWKVTDSSNDIEGRLDRFARALLLPSTAVRTHWREKIASHSLREAAVLLGSRFRVDMATLARRLRELGLIEPSEAATVRGTTTTQADIVEFGLYVPRDLEGTTLPVPYQKAILRAFRDERLSRERTLDLLQDTFQDSDLPALRERREDEIWKFVS